jgi:hypothetical protein
MLEQRDKKWCMEWFQLQCSGDLILQQLINTVAAHLQDHNSDCKEPYDYLKGLAVQNY